VFGGQQRHFTRIDVEYVLDLPSPAWQVVSAIDVHDHPDFINGSDPANGFLRLRKIFVDRPANAAELFRQQEKWELQRLPGYVVCTACAGMRFDGLLMPRLSHTNMVVVEEPCMDGSIICKSINIHTTPYTSQSRATDSRLSVKTWIQ
jgi:hypothetical protein